MSPEVALALALVFGGPADTKQVAKPNACPNCSTCGTDCRCFGSGYYCADGKCPIEFKQSAQPAYIFPQGCPGGVCPVPQYQYVPQFQPVFPFRRR